LEVTETDPTPSRSTQLPQHNARRRHTTSSSSSLYEKWTKQQKENFVQKDATESFFPYDDFYPSDLEVTETDPTPSRSTQLPQNNARQCCTTSLSSSLYDDSPLVSVSATYAQIAKRPRQCFSSSWSTYSHLLLPNDCILASTCSRSSSLTPEQPKIYMPQISFDPLPVLKEGEGLEENEEVAISIVDGHNTWTVVQRKKKNSKKKKDSLSEKWTKQQKENFVHFGDIWQQEPYINYHVAEHFTPVANIPQPQQQPQQLPVLQQQQPVQQPQPVLPPQQPAVLPPQLPAIQPNQPTLLPPPPPRQPVP
jgi:hypothetical protein